MTVEVRTAISNIDTVEKARDLVALLYDECFDKNYNFHNSYCEGKAHAYEFCSQMLNNILNSNKTD